MPHTRAVRARTRLLSAVVAVVAAAGLAACTSGDSHTTAGNPFSGSAPGLDVSASSAAARSGTGAASSTAPTTPTQRSSGADSIGTAPSSRAKQVLASMSLRQRVGQLLMVDCPSSGLPYATRTAITRYHVGSVILDGLSTAGSVPIASLTRRLRALAPRGVGLFVSTDQEGGLVQRLQGSGFSHIPSGVSQGFIAPATLQRDARTWGRQLKAVGVNVDLAPVLDTVPSGFGANPPIGDLDREYGHTPGTVRSHGVAFAQGLAAAGVGATVKHFPGLGRVHGNTDLTSGVLDTVTTRHDAYLAPFAAAIKAHVPFVMVSTAIYTRIDAAHPATFSRTVITGMLRHDLHFGGVVMTDDVGNARQVSGYSVAARAVDFVRAGGDMVLTVDAGQAATMTGALVSAATQSASFRALVNAAALRVLTAKQNAHLL